MFASMRRMKLSELLEEKVGIHSSAELRQAIGGSPAQASNLWHGRDSIGAMVIVRLLRAFPTLTIDDLLQVDQAAKALKPPKRRDRRPTRHPPDSTADAGPTPEVP